MKRDNTKATKLVRIRPPKFREVFNKLEPEILDLD